MSSLSQDLSQIEIMVTHTPILTYHGGKQVCSFFSRDPCFTGWPGCPLQKVVAQLPRTDFTEKQGKLGWGALESVEFSYLSLKVSYFFIIF